MHAWCIPPALPGDAAVIVSDLEEEVKYNNPILPLQTGKNGCQLGHKGGYISYSHMRSIRADST